MRFKRTRKPLLSLESVAITDIIMNLFIFFFITFSFLATFRKAQESRTEVHLPAGAQPQRKDAETRTLVVTMTRTGELFLDEQPVTLEQLESRFQAEKASGAQVVLAMRADAEASHGRVVEVLELARAAGIEELSIATRVPPGQNPAASP